MEKLHLGFDISSGSDIATYITGIITLGSSILLILATLETIRRKPYISFRIRKERRKTENGNAITILYLIIENIGNGTAFNLKSKVLKDMNLISSSQSNEYMLSSIDFFNGHTTDYYPGQSRESKIRSYFGAVKEDIDKRTFTIEIEYEEEILFGKRKKRTQIFKHDLKKRDGPLNINIK